jgi:hypothetical protein
METISGKHSIKFSIKVTVLGASHVLRKVAVVQEDCQGKGNLRCDNNNNKIIIIIIIIPNQNQPQIGFFRI